MKRHLKRLAAPKTWAIQRKGIKYIAKPLPGPHKLKECVTLNAILKDFLKRSKTAKETKVILNKGHVLVDNIVRKEHRFPVGIMDTVSIPSLNEYYRLLYSKKGKFTLQPIKKEEASQKICKIIKKTILKGNKIQINLYDGRNILVPKDIYKVGDSVVLQDSNIKKHLKLEKGAKIYLVGGGYVGSEGILENIKKFNGRSSDIIVLAIDSTKVETNKDYAFVIE